MPIEFTPVKADPKLKELGIHSDTYGDYDFVEIARELQSLKAQGLDGQQKYIKIVRTISPDDFFFFCYFVLDLPINHPFLVARAYEVQRESHRTIDLWARGHWKSTLLTLAKPIHELIVNREERICIFSHTRSLAKAHLRKIKHELEQNRLLWWAFPDIFYHEPQKKSPKWSEDEGLYVRRNGNYPAASVEAWGLIEKMPAGKHFSIRIYDDIVTETAVQTKTQLEKVERQFKLSENLSTNKQGSQKAGRKRIIGTRYSHRDLYGGLIEIKGNTKWKVRLYPSEVDDKGEFCIGGKPVLLAPEELEEKYADMGEYIYSAQMGQNPVSGGMQKFRRSWLKEWNPHTTKPYMNIYLIGDPAEVDTTKTDYSSFFVIGTDHLKNYWVLDIVRERMELGQKWETIKNLVLKWNPLHVGYEVNKGYSDVQYYEMMMQQEGVMFSIMPLKSYRGNSKHKRIHDLQPIFERNKIILPVALAYEDKEKVVHDLVYEFIEDEYLLYPFGKHDDMLDTLSFILDPDMAIFFPTRKEGFKGPGGGGDDPLNMRGGHSGGGSWMSY
jgi:phage terminase large subunit-like protein